jgi:hypothetical protein
MNKISIKEKLLKQINSIKYDKYVSKIAILSDYLITI